MLFVFVSMDGFVITCLVLLSTPLRARATIACLSLSLSLSLCSRYYCGHYLLLLVLWNFFVLLPHASDLVVGVVTV
jgi:hypothetical protein